MSDEEFYQKFRVNWDYLKMPNNKYYTGPKLKRKEMFDLSNFKPESTKPYLRLEDDPVFKYITASDQKPPKKVQFVEVTNPNIHPLKWLRDGPKPLEHDFNAFTTHLDPRTFSAFTTFFEQQRD